MTHKNPSQDMQNAAQPGGEPSSANAKSPSGSQAWIDLANFRNDEYSPGRGLMVRAAWYVISIIVFESGWFPLGGLKAWLLRRFGARIGKGLVIKPNVRIKYPWRLTIGDHCWIGQGVWIDNLAAVRVGDHVCISQAVYLCTGSHDYRRRSFDLITAPIAIETGTWIGAQAMVLPGCTVGPNALVAAGAVVRQSVNPGDIVAGNPARCVSHRLFPT